MQVWPRVRAKRSYARVRTWHAAKEAKILGFAGYKAGMTHVIVTDNRSHSMTKGQEISMPVTVIECPPLRVAAIRLYKKTPKGLSVSAQVPAEKVEKELGRKLVLPKQIKSRIENVHPDAMADVRLLVYTQPKLTGIGKKKPEVFELGIGGNVKDKFEFAKNVLGKELRINDFAREGQQVDIHGISKGKGTQGPVRRFGVSLRSHKSEKAVRNPGNVGPWTGPQSWRVAHAGKTGFNQRTEFNKWIVKIGDMPKEINPKGAFPHYGIVKNQYTLLKGSLPGSAKRLVIMKTGSRQDKKLPKDAPAITYVSQESKQ